MKPPKIDAVILYSSNDSRFFNTCIQNLINANVTCHVVTYSHMWNGTEENSEVLANSAQNFTGHPLYNQYSINWAPGYTPWYWEACGRYLATEQVSSDSDYILYIDIDEIIETESFVRFISRELDNGYDAIKLKNYWYWRLPIYRATTTEHSPLLIKTKLAKTVPFTPGGREVFLPSVSTLHHQLSEPFIHHYSWVRTKDEMINKVNNWGHAFDKANWIELINTEFSREFNGKDFLHNYSYTIVDNQFNI